MSFGGGGETTQTTTVDIPDWLRPQIDRSFGHYKKDEDRLRRVEDRLLERGALTQKFTDVENQGRWQLYNFANGADGVLPTAQDAYLKAAQGYSVDDLNPGGAGILGQLQQQRGLDEFVDPNAYNSLSSIAAGDHLSGDLFDRELNAGVDAARRAAASTFRGGSSLGQASLGAEVGRVFDSNLSLRRNQQMGAANTLAGLSDSEAGRRQRANEFATSMGERLKQLQLQGAQGSVKLGALPGQLKQALGQDERALKQANVDRKLSLFNSRMQRQMPFVAPQQYLGSTTSTPYYSNQGAGILGGIMSGAQMGSSIMPGWGTAIGAVGGGILGAF